jgi:anti-sigma factor ChrR (cupin superfamily)
MDGRATLKSIWRDDTTKRHAMFWWLKPGLIQPLHEHIGEELVFMMEGCLIDEGGTLSAGNLGVRPYGCHHSFTTPNGALGLAYMWGSTAFI